MGTPMQEEKKPVGAVIGIIVIVLVIAFGAYYFLKQVPVSMENSTVPPVQKTSTSNADATVSALSSQGTSTDLADIQKDLNASDFSTLDMGLSSVSI